MTHEVKSYKWRGVEHLGMFLLKVPQFNYTEKKYKSIFFSSLSDNQNPSNSKNKNKKSTCCGYVDTAHNCSACLE